ncbi:PTS sugar transporter subunit IIA [Enterococcus mediterraneensis]|uniref:PTS sugar transporter subunit IIA n=1 Tax=Enterococcus mediterraneensis TaxID=2364791 RepID=UPI000F0724CD|nr:PTS mannose/fructose/sorbose family IIA subunit [Enterococcus mediterraneensis]
MKIILCGHGYYGNALKESAEMIAGSQPQLTAIDFTPELAVKDLVMKMQEVILENEHEEIIILTDIPGGSPANAATLCKKLYPTIHVVTGCSLVLLLSLLLTKDISEACQDGQQAMQEIRLEEMK